MKAFKGTMLFPRWMSAIVVGVLVAAGSASNLSARHDDDRHEFERKIRLSPTEAAPANATGVAELEVGHHSSSRSNRIEVETHGLLPGTYTVTVFDRAGTSSVILGELFVGGHDDDDDDNGDDHRGRGRGRGSDDDEGEAKFSAPDSISAADLGVISVTDSAGVEVLNGDFSDLSDAVRGRVRVRVPVVAGDAAPEASGRAEVKGNVNRSRGTGTFKLDASGLPANTTLLLFVNGVEVDSVQTDRKGRLRIRANHRSFDVLSISTISLRDESGGEVLTASF